MRGNLASERLRLGFNLKRRDLNPNLNPALNPLPNLNLHLNLNLLRPITEESRLRRFKPAGTLLESWSQVLARIPCRADRRGVGHALPSPVGRRGFPVPPVAGHSARR